MEAERDELVLKEKIKKCEKLWVVVYKKVRFWKRNKCNATYIKGIRKGE